MATITVQLKIDEDRVLRSLEEAREQLNGEGGEVVLDFSSVLRIDTGTLRGIEDFVKSVSETGVKVELRGVNVGVYKVLKLAKLASWVSLVN